MGFKNTLLQEKLLHYTVSFIGGIFAIYALLEHSNVFGSAETSNMILLVKDLLNLDAYHIVIRIGNLLVYAAGITASLIMAKYHPNIQKFICFLIDGAAAIVICFMPANMNPVIALYPIAFAMSIQWCTFRGVDNNPSATTFSTGNFRQLLTNLFNYITEGDKKYLSGFKFYLFTMLSFHVGIAVLYLVWQYAPHYSIMIVYIPLAVAALQEIVIVNSKNACNELIPQSSGSDEV